MSQQRVVVARYTDIYFQSKEYILNEHGQIRCFINKQSAESFMFKIMGVPPEQFDMYLYEPVSVCSSCNHSEINPKRVFITADGELCEDCYYS